MVVMYFPSNKCIEHKRLLSKTLIHQTFAHFSSPEVLGFDSSARKTIVLLLRVTTSPRRQSHVIGADQTRPAIISRTALIYALKLPTSTPESPDPCTPSFSSLSSLRPKHLASPLISCVPLLSCLFFSLAYQNIFCDL